MAAPAETDTAQPPASIEPGQRVGPGPATEVGAAVIARFAAALGSAGALDPAPPTLVVALALDSPGGPVDLIAPLVAAGAVGGVVHGDQQLRVHRPVRAGDRLAFASTVLTVRTLSGATVAAISTEVRDAAGAPVADLQATFVLTGPAA